MDINNISVSGFLAKDCTVVNKNDFNIINFTIGSNYYDKSTKTQKPNFINCVYFVKNNTLQTMLLKGVRVFVAGELRQNVYTDKNGTQKQDYKIIVNNLVVISKVNNNDTTVNNDYYDESMPWE